MIHTQDYPWITPVKDEWEFKVFLYIVTIDEFFSDVSGKPKMSDLLKYAANLQNNLELRPPKKMIRALRQICSSLRRSSSDAVNNAPSRLESVTAPDDPSESRYR